MGIFLHWSFLSGAHPDILCHPELSPLLLRRVMVVMRTKSGFTALTEKFIQRSGPDRGTDELAQTLNDYLCDILEEMLIFGGDIFKFAGDAVLVLWRAPPRELAKTISLVLQCSRQIQRKYGNRDTRVGQKVRLKIGISAGPMDLLLVGDRRRQYFLICGQALDEVREAEELANAGEVILSATSWELCEQHRLRTRRPAGKRAVKVTGMDRMSWSECQDALRKLVQHPRSRRLEGEGAMRPALPLPSGPNAHDMLSKYISEAALRKLDDRVPLELFSELRPVTSLFVQLQLTAGINTVAIHTAVHDASRMMLEILCPHKGEINKIVLFDKGCVFLCVFGLGGEKLPYESIHALQSASQIFNSCSMMLMETEAVSVAVTSGTVFCGVTGHPLRHEYTVIGQKVNLAARMMVHYPGLVSCDAVTYASSRLPPYYFKELPERKMKGLSHPGTVYQYVGITKKSIFGMGLAKKRSEYAPLLGREKEIDLFGSCLKAYEDLGQRHILAFEGRWAPERATYLPNWPISARLLATASRESLLETLPRSTCMLCSRLYISGELEKEHWGRKAFLWSGKQAAKACSPKAKPPLAPSLPLSPMSSSAGGRSETWAGAGETQESGPGSPGGLAATAPLCPFSYEERKAWPPLGSTLRRVADKPPPPKGICTPFVLEGLGCWGSQSPLLLHGRVVAMELLEVNMKQSFCAIRTLMARALGLQDCEQCGARQHTLQTELRGTIEESSFCLLNDIFLVEFPVSDKVREMRGIERKKELHSTWAKVLEKTIGGEFGIFVIDNAHFIDPASWSIMSPLLRNVSYFMVMSLAPGYARTEGFCKAAADNTTSQKITYLRLDELKPSAVVQTVCQNLRVDSTDLARFLIQRSSGIPYYCKELLGCLLCNDMLLLRTRRRAEKAEDNWESLIIEASPLAATSSSSAGNDGRVCIIRPDVNPENTVLPTTLKEIALAQLDRIKPLKQTVLKFAAVIGPVFTTQLLSHILPDGMRHKMNCLLDMLVSDNILKWLKTTEVPEDVRDPTKRPGTSRQAGSGVERPSPSKKTTERQSGVLVFCVPLPREAAYELWPERQRVALHRKCAAFLERHAHKCKSCGQGDFVAFHRFTVTRTWEGGSSQGPAEQGDPHSWEALVLAGEQLTIC
ncbi:adenylate cyclase type 10-like [Harpia harpyja]|uniref:adenylate cyclase type 10-like n=1 Tax=Harpia harpyja TaxID=202280 RepID=UPI0022B21964|nr:adenylate cyclase type 10-like [Harpia harpyja]